MNDRRVGWVVWFVFAWGAAMAAGCAKPLPTYPWTGADAALETMGARAGAVRSFRSPCRITLTGAGGESVTLDGAVAARRPDHLRLRAWKLGHAAFDLTVAPEGVWVMTPERAGRGATEAAGFLDGLDDPRIGAVWTVLAGDLFDEESARVEDRGGATFRVERPLSGGGEGAHADGPATLVCDIDRATLTARRYTLLAADGRVLHTLTLDRYRLVGETVWPLRLTASGPEGELDLVLDGPELNAALDAAVFTPPRRAVKRR